MQKRIYMKMIFCLLIIMEVELTNIQPKVLNELYVYFLLYKLNKLYF